MDRLWTVSATLLFCISAAVSDADIEPEVTIKLKNVQYGLFRTTSEGSSLRYCGRGIKTATDHISIRDGAKFGVLGRLNANRGDIFQVIVQWDFPAQIRPGTDQPVTRDIHMTYLRNHRDFATCYMFEHPWEMVPGRWSLRIVLTGIDDVRIERGPNRKLPYWTPLYEKVFVVDQVSD